LVLFFKKEHISLSGAAAAPQTDWRQKSNPWLIAVVVPVAAFM